MYFSSFLVLDRRTDTLRLNLPAALREARFAGAVELSEKAVEQLFGRATRLNNEHEIGVLVSQQLDATGSYLLYLEPGAQLEEKYRAFMQRVLVSICGCVCFGERVNYARMSRRPGQPELPDQAAYFITEKAEDVEAYRIKSLADSRLEIGLKLPKDQIRKLACAEQDKNRACVAAFLTELEGILQSRNNFANSANLNDPFDDICKTLLMKAEVEQFQRDVLGTTHVLLPKTEVDRLSQSVESICYRIGNSKSMVDGVVHCFRAQLQRHQQTYLKDMLALISEELHQRKPVTYSELRDMLGVESKLIDAKLADYVDNSQQLSQLVLFDYFQKQAERLVGELCEQLYDEQETKRCLTSEIYQQIQISDKLRIELEAAKARLEELSDFDEKLTAKEREIDECRWKLISANEQLRSLKDTRKKLETEVGDLMQALVEGSMEKGRLSTELQQRNSELRDLQKEHSALRATQDKLTQDCRHHSKKLNCTSNSLQACLSENRDLANTVGQYKSAVCEFQNNLKHLQQSEVRKTNRILQLNLQAHNKLRDRAGELQRLNKQLSADVEKLGSRNTDLTNRLVYYQRLYRLRCQSPYGLLESSSPSSAFDNRINQSVSDMVIFEQNDENETSDRLERKQKAQMQAEHLNETFDGNRNSPENTDAQPHPARRSEGCLQQCSPTMLKKRVVIRADRSDWDLNSSARQSEHRLDIAAPDSVEPTCKAKYF